MENSNQTRLDQGIIDHWSELLGINFLAFRNIAMPDRTFFNIFSICLSHFSFSSNNTAKHSKVMVLLRGLLFSMTGLL